MYSLVAIMLGRLEMDIESCIDAYLKMSASIFKPKRHKFNYLSRAVDFFYLNERFDSDLLAETFKSITRRCGPDDAKLRDGAANPRCRMSV
jgi:hypothetical protein